MEPKDIVRKHTWLFDNGFVRLPINEQVENQMGIGYSLLLDEKDEIEKKRIEALTEIVCEQGVSGVLELAKKGKRQNLIGFYVASGILANEQIKDMILRCLKLTENDSKYGHVIVGMLHRLDHEKRIALYQSIYDRITEEETFNFLLCLPYRAVTWQFVDQFSIEIRNRYWKEVKPYYLLEFPEENNESVHCLLAIKRFRAAFTFMSCNLKDMQPSLLRQILFDMGTQKTNDKNDEYPLNNYCVWEAFQVLNRDPDLTIEEKANLEFLYLDILISYIGEQGKSKIPNLELCIEEHPELFVQAMVWFYKRDDGGEDPSAFCVMEDCKALYAQRGYNLLTTLQRIPGQDKSTKKEQYKKLSEWISIVRKSCAELDRAEIADICLGNFLSKASIGKDGVWPNEVVRDVIEDLQSEAISDGIYEGLYNARGAHMVDETGNQERQLVDQYRNWADALRVTHPFVSSSVLKKMANIYEKEARQQVKDAEKRRHFPGY